MLYFDNIKTTLKALLSANVNANVITILDTSWLPVSLGAEETFKMVLIRGREYEVVRVTAINPDKTLTVVRAQDSTTVKEWPGVETEIINAPLASDHAFFQSLQKRENHTGKQDVSTIEGLDGAIAGKVDKVAGKGLSTEDFSSADKTKLNGIAVNATANATDADLRDRTKHTGITPITGGGTGAGTLAVAQANLNVPTRTGGSASGTWGINVTGTSGGAPWSGVSGKPTTLEGYGITNGMPKTGGTFTGAVSYSAGTKFGSVVGTTPQDFSKHIALYENFYGFSITGSSLNYVAADTASHNFFAGAANVANLSSAGKLTVLGGVTARKGLCLVGSTPGMTADNYAAGRSIQVNTDTAAFGGPHEDHSCFVVHPYMGAGWGSGEMRVLIATGAGSYNYGSPALIVGEGGVTHKGNITAYSDRKLKDNIETIDNALDMVNAMRGVYYTLKADPSKRRQVGVIAQEMLDVLPEVVSSVKPDTKSDEETLVVAYANTIAVLIEAVKELSTEVAALKARVA